MYICIYIYIYIYATPIAMRRDTVVREHHNNDTNDMNVV